MNVKRLMMVVVAWSLAAMPALAQDLPRAPEKTDGWKGLVATILLVACVVAVSIMSSKRSHQD